MKRLIPLIFLLLAGHMTVRAQIGGQVEVNVNGLSFSKQDNYDVVHWNGGDDRIRQVGAPELPVILKTYVIPLEAKPTGVEVSVSNRMAVDGTFTPYPVQPPIPINDKANDVKFTQPDASIYQGTEIFPKVKAKIVADYNEMGYHLVTVQLTPVEYDPVSQKLFVSRLDFTLRYDMIGVDGIQPQKQSVRRADAVKKVIRSMVDNPEDVDGFTNQKVKVVGGGMPDVQTRAASSMPINVIQEQIPDYIIITNNELKSEFQRLADWKTQKGVPTLIKDVESIGKEYQGADLAEKIHTYLQECYHKWGAGLFVLLGGDTNIIPARLYWSTYDTKNPPGFYPSDAYFVDLNSDWNANKNHIYREDKDGMKRERLCYIGRATVENIAETKILISRILSYEKLNVTNANYLMNHLAVSAYTYYDYKGKLSSDGQIPIDSYLSRYSQLHKWYLFDHYNCTCSEHDLKPMFQGGEELNKANFISALENGGKSGLNHFHIVYHMDHCNPRSIGVSSLDKHEYLYINDIDELNYENYPQIVISGGCKPAKFTEDCIAEHLLTNPHGGTVAFIGNADIGYVTEYSQYDLFLKALYDNKINTLGALYNKMLYSNNGIYPYSEYYRLHLLGDPEMPVWSAVPQKLEVNVTPTQIEAGTNTITVQITNLPAGEEATVCLMKDAEAYAVVTINDTKPHSFTFTPKTAGEMKVTVTARNFLPLEKTVPVSVNSGNLLSVGQINDFGGYVLAGMGQDFDIVLKNNGKTLAKNVTATLSSSSPYVTILNGTVDYGTIGAGQSKNGAEKFTVKISEDAPEATRNEWNAPCFYLMMKKDGTDIVDVDTFKVDLKHYKFRIANLSIASGSSLKPGGQLAMDLNVDILGDVTSLVLNWEIIPLNPSQVEIIKITSSACLCSLTNAYVPGSSLTFDVKLSIGNMRQDSVRWDVTERAVPVDLTKVTSELGADAISFHWDKMGGETKYNVYRSTSENGVYDKLNALPLDTRYYKDEGLQPLTTYYYKFSTLTRGMVESELSPAVRTWTTYPTMGMFPLSMGKSLHYTCEAHTFDFDYDGQKEIWVTGNTDESTEGTVVALRPDGTEPYDLDGNATSYSGYAKIPWNAEATPVVADLLGNGEQCIIVPTRNDKGENYIICYSSLDKDGDKLPDKLWETHIGKIYSYRSVVVTDIDAPDGKGEKEIILRGEKPNTPVIVLDARGKEVMRTGNTTGDFYGVPAVADLDDDGYKEIICGSNDGKVYVWRHDGTPYLRTPFFSRVGQMLNCSPTVCDLDGDGEKEILITTRSTALSYIYAIKRDGSCVGYFTPDATQPVSIPYTNAPGSGIEHPISVGDINGDGQPEVVVLGNECVRAWTHTGTLIFDRNLSGLFPNEQWAINMATPILADVDGDGSIDIVFHQDKLIYALHNDGTDVKGYPLSAPAHISNGVCVSDMDSDGKNEIIAVDNDGSICAWKTDGKSTAIEWGRSRFDTGFTGEYVPHYEDPKVLTASTEWGGGAFTNDIIVRSGTFKIPSGKTLQMRDGYRIYVLEGGTLEVDGGTIQNADVLVKSGGTLNIKNNGGIHLNRYGKLNAEKGAIVNALYGEVQTAR